MIAYKLLGEGGLGRLSGFRWPLPEGSNAGAWVEVSAPLVPCRSGVHACSRGDIPYWLDGELWEVELDGQIERHDQSLLASRGRLLRRLDAWGAEARVALGGFCAARAADAAARAARANTPCAELAQRWAADAAALAAQGNVATAAYVSAVTAHAASALAPEAAFAAERQVQAEFLATLLDLPR